MHHYLRIGSESKRERLEEGTNGRRSTNGHLVRGIVRLHMRNGAAGDLLEDGRVVLEGFGHGTIREQMCESRRDGPAVAEALLEREAHRCVACEKDWHLMIAVRQDASGTRGDVVRRRKCRDPQRARNDAGRTHVVQHALNVERQALIAILQTCIESRNRQCRRGRRRIAGELCVDLVVDEREDGHRRRVGGLVKVGRQHVEEVLPRW